MPIPATGPSVLLVAALLLAASPVEPQQVTPKEVLVRWRAGASRVSGSGVSAIDSLHRAYRLRSERPLFPAPAPVRRAARSPELALGRWSMLRFEADVPAQEIARQYLRLPAIEAAQPNFLRRVT